MPPLRVLSVDLDALPSGPSDLAGLIEQAGPHVVCVHGAPSLLRWRSRCAALARVVGMVVVGGGRTGGGNLTLSTLGVEVSATRDLAFAGTRGPRPAGATVAVLSLLGSDFVFASARLEGDEAKRANQAALLNREAAGGDTPVIVCVSGAGLATAPSHHALANRREALGERIFVDERIAVSAFTELRATPVPPLLVELELP